MIADATMNNWAGNVTYSTTDILRPRSVEETQELVARTDLLRPLGTRHSFNRVADSIGTLVSTEHLDQVIEIGEGTVTVEAGIRYGALSSALHEHGLALMNMASLPHISVGGAIATATHGSGVANVSLAAAVSGFELICADGSLRRLDRGDGDFDGAVVSLGSLGLVARTTLEVVPEFELPSTSSTTCRGRRSSTTSTRSWPGATASASSRRGPTAGSTRCG
jgi:alditol oxidase